MKAQLGIGEIVTTHVLPTTYVTGEYKTTRSHFIIRPVGLQALGCFST